MTRTELREYVFKLLFRVEFNEPEDMAQQETLFFADDETVFTAAQPRPCQSGFSLLWKNRYSFRPGRR